LQRVSAVVILRMLHESPVASQLAVNGGIPLMLQMVKEQVEEVETATAACHILYSITDPAVGASVKLESALTPDCNVTGLLQALRIHTNRLDLIRAACRTLSNLAEYPRTAQVMHQANTVETMLRVVQRHPRATDVAECCGAVFVAMKAFATQSNSQYAAGKGAAGAPGSGAGNGSKGALAAQVAAAAAAAHAVGGLQLPAAMAPPLLLCLKAHPQVRGTPTAP
jgi:hypothetical protein